MTELSGKFNHTYQWFIAPILLAMIYWASMNLVSTFFLLEKSRHESMWSLEHLNREIESTVHETQLYMANASSREKLHFQYELLWSRLPVVQNSLRQDQRLAHIIGLSALVEQVFNRVRSMEQEFSSTGNLNTNRLIHWIGGLERDRESLSNYLIHEISAGEGQYSQSGWRQLLVSIYMLGFLFFMLILVFGHLVLVLLQEQNRQRVQIEKDSLTGLYSRNFIMQKVDELCKQRKDFTLMFIDLNKFKVVNDTYGHQAGDELLIYVARHFQATLEKIGLVGRVGGDEFVWVIPQADNREIAQCYTQLLMNLCQPLKFGAQSLFASLSIGAVQAGECNYEPSILIEQCDAAMYKAKSERSNAIIWSHDLPSSVDLARQSSCAMPA